MYTCPVCGYNQLKYPPKDETICPSCYTEFGYDDATRSHYELRQEWLANGPRWEGSNVMPAPYGWQPYEQLKNIGILSEPRSQAKGNTRIEIVDLGRQSKQVRTAPGVITIQGHLYALGTAVTSVVAPTVRKETHA